MKEVDILNRKQNSVDSTRRTYEIVNFQFPSHLSLTSTQLLFKLSMPNK